MTDGVFSPAARAAIYELGDHRCIGCGRPDVTAQHRRARGMGGTTDVVIGHPANGVPLCGSGTIGCHWWTENHPRYGRLLGWALEPGELALVAPFWHRLYNGWRRWVELDGTVGHAHVDDTDLDRPAERADALTMYRRWRHR